MDVIPYPRRPAFDHIEVPLLFEISQTPVGENRSYAPPETSPCRESTLSETAMDSTDELQSLSSTPEHRRTTESVQQPAFLETHLGKRPYDGKGFAEFPERQGWDSRFLRDSSSPMEFSSFFCQKPPDETAAFIQSWLFVGMLSEVLNEPVPVESLVTKTQDGRNIITLQKFAFSKKFSSWWARIAELPEDQQKSRRKSVEHCFTMASKFTRLEDLHATYSRLAEDDVNKSLPLSPLEQLFTWTPSISELCFSIRTLGILLTDACPEHEFGTFASGSPCVQIWGLGDIISTRMLHRNQARFRDHMDWHVDDINRLAGYLPATALYYLSTMLGPTSNPDIMQDSHRHDKVRPLQGHSVKRKFSKAPNEPEHIPCCDGNCGLVGPAMDDVKKILSEGGIPLIKFRDPNPKNGLFTNLMDWVLNSPQVCGGNGSTFERFRSIIESRSEAFHQADSTNADIKMQGTLNSLPISLDVIPYAGKTPFIAISHVSGDGLGNAASNMLPRCRIPFLQRALWHAASPLKLYDRKEISTAHLRSMRTKFTKLWEDPISAFWLDTFCTPIDGPLKKIALHRMKDAYKNSKAALMIDERLSGSSLGSRGNGLLCESRTRTECLGLALASPWMRRLWETQEVHLAKSHLVQFSEGPIKVETLVRGIRLDDENQQPRGIIAKQFVRAFSSMIDASKQAIQRRVYQRLRENGEEIRIFELSPGSDESWAVCGRFSVVDFKRNPKYTALSYEWGAPRLSKPIYVENDLGVSTEFKITENLYGILETFSRRKSPRTIWIDALCIDQNSRDEKIHQIKLMDQIYSKAKETIMWLGAESENTRQAFEGARVYENFMKNGSSSDSSAEQDLPKAFQCLDQLMRCTYWTRVWVQQEVALSTNAKMQCGDWSCDWRPIATLIPFTQTMPTYLINQYRPDGTLYHMENAPRLLAEACSIFQYQGHLSLLEALVLGRERDATHHCDKVYGILSLCNEKEIDAKYDIDLGELYQDVALRVIEAGDGLDILAACKYFNPKKLRTDNPIRFHLQDIQQRKTTPDDYDAYEKLEVLERVKKHEEYVETAKNLPSWVPNWAEVWDHRTYLALKEGRTCRYRASGDCKADFKYEAPSRLRVKGATVDTVAVAPFASFCDLKFRLTEADGNDDPPVLPVDFKSLVKEHWDMFNDFVGKHSKNPYGGEQARLEAFLTCLFAADPNPLKIPFGYDGEEDLKAGAIKAFAHQLKLKVLPDEDFKGLLREFPKETIDVHRSSHFKTRFRKFFVTYEGLIGLGPENTTKDDVVVVIYGTKTPFILRKDDEDYKLKEECYVHGIMNGEIMHDSGGKVRHDQYFVLS